MSRLLYSFIIFCIGFITILMIKPRLFFYGKTIKPLLINGQQINSLKTLHLFIILWAVISYILAYKINI
jgi:hypothetical protein